MMQEERQKITGYLSLSMLISSGSSLFFFFLFSAQILNHDFLFGLYDVSRNMASCSLGTERRETRRKRMKVALNMHFNGGANIFQIGRKQTGVRYSTGQQPDWGCDVRRDKRVRWMGRGERRQRIKSWTSTSCLVYCSLCFHTSFFKKILCLPLLHSSLL